MVGAPESARLAQAMEAALAAERAAEDAVREAQQAAALAIREATERAAQIARRCDVRVQRVHDGCAAALADRVTTLLREGDAAEGPVQAHDSPLDEPLDRVAAWLTSSR